MPISSATVPGIHGYGVIASRPTAGLIGATYVSTDETGSPKHYRDNGTTWDDITPPAGVGASFSWTAKTANYTITGADSGILGDATGGNITITLPTAVSVTKMFAIKKKDASANTVTVATTSSQTIDGSTTKVLSTRYDGIVVWSDGANWFIAALPLSSGGGGGLFSAYLLYQHQATSGTAGGSLTAATWNTRALTTEVADTGNHGTLASNQVTLDAGTYRVSAVALGYVIGVHQLRLRDITNSATLATGTSNYETLGTITNIATLRGYFTLAGSTVIELQHNCGVTNSSSGQGVAAGLGTEVYSSLEFFKV